MTDWIKVHFRKKFLTPSFFLMAWCSLLPRTQMTPNCPPNPPKGALLGVKTPQNEVNLTGPKIFSSHGIALKIAFLPQFWHEIWYILKPGCANFWLSKFWKIQRGDPSMSKKFSSPILMKLKIWNLYRLRMWHMKFEQNRRRKISWHRRVPPLVFSK